MGTAFVPGLLISENIHITKKRVLPIKGDILIKVGDTVEPQTIIARFLQPGIPHTINAANILGVAPNELGEYLLKKEGDTVNKDEVIAQTKSFIKIFRATLTSPVKGIITNISFITGQIIVQEPPIPVNLYAYLKGKVTQIIESYGAVIETNATYIQGIFGIGKEFWGNIKVLVESPDNTIKSVPPKSEIENKILVCGSYIDLPILKALVENGAKGIIVGGIDDLTIKEILGYEIGVAITGNENTTFALVVTEGFGQIPINNRAFTLLQKNDGKLASISGATQIRAGVQRPEIIIYTEEEKSAVKMEYQGVKIGDTVRIIRYPYFGLIGKVVELPPQPVKIDTESITRIVKVSTPDNNIISVPRANIEIISG